MSCCGRQQTLQWKYQICFLITSSFIQYSGQFYSFTISRCTCL
jgi:hypothetical protein